MKKILLIPFFIFSCFIMYSQSDIRINSYLENTYYINPSAINKDYVAEFSMLARKQWVNFPGSPRTFYGTAAVYFDEVGMQLGLKLYTDKIGYTNTTNVGLSYAYDVQLSRRWNLLLGISGNYENFSYDQSQIDISTDDPVLSQMLYQRDYFNSDLGFELRYEQLKIGVSSKNFVSLFLNKDRKRIQPNTSYLYVLNRTEVSDWIDLGYGGCGIYSDRVFQLELNFSTFIRWSNDYDYIQLGLLYRTKSEIGFLFGFDVTGAFRIAYSYDYHTGGISRSSVGTHELMLTYRIGRLFQCKRCD